MADDLFEGLPPPSSNTLLPHQQQQLQPQPIVVATNINDTESSAVPAPKPILKSALKRPNPTQPDTQGQFFFPPLNRLFPVMFSSYFAISINTTLGLLEFKPINN